MDRGINSKQWLSVRLYLLRQSSIVISFREINKCRRPVEILGAKYVTMYSAIQARPKKSNKK